MATKRRAADAIGGAPPAKKMSMSPLDIGPAAGEEDLNLKVLQVQNHKLSERLGERNRHQEQLEIQVEKMEQTHEEYLKFQVSLKQQFVRLRDLLVATVPLRSEEHVMSEEEVGNIQQVGGLDKVMQSLFKCVDKLYRASVREGKLEADQPSSSTDEKSMNQDNSIDSKALTLLDEITHRMGDVESEQLQETLALLEAKCKQLQEDLADARFSLEQSQTRGDRQETRLEATLLELHSHQTYVRTAQSAEDGQEGSTTNITSAAERGGVTTVDRNDEVETLRDELQYSKEVANSRGEEMAHLSSQLVEARQEVDRLKLEQQQVSGSVVKESATYKGLQSQFSIAALEGAQLRMCLDEAKALLVSARQQHFSQLEEIRAEEIKYQMEIREEMKLLENALATVKHDYEMLRVEFERNVASNEQAGPIAKELQVTVESLRKTISQHKSEVNRYKLRAHKAEQQLAKEEREKEGKDKTVSSGNQNSTMDLAKVKETDHGSNKAEEEKELNKIKEQLKTAELELESYREACSAEVREKADVIAAEKKARGQVEELKKRFEDFRRDYEKRKEHLREEATRKTKLLTEDNRHLQKDLNAKKHEAHALVSEMECTAQAFEEMQEQNLRLLQQLKEKDDANFKLMSERIKSNSMYKLLLEEKELLHDQLNGMLSEQQRHAEFVAQLEERERTTEATIQGMDREVNLQQQANESHRKRAEDSLQELAQLQFQMNEKQKLLENIQGSLFGKTAECEKESQMHKRSMEEFASVKRKLEKHRTREWMAAGDEVLLEEIKVYKAKLNCPCCSARKKDTVLTKCFHVFCSECIRNRYDSRLRKCPKCGAAFGANDFHKIYLS